VRTLSKDNATTRSVRMAIKLSSLPLHSDSIAWCGFDDCIRKPSEKFYPPDIGMKRWCDGRNGAGAGFNVLKQAEKSLSTIKLVFSYFYNFISDNNTTYLAVKMGIFPPSTEMLASYII